MPKPRFTDEHKYPHGYTPANKTDVTKTWDRVIKQRQRDEEEARAKVTPMQRTLRK